MTRIQNSTNLEEDENPCSPAMFMKLGWSTPADDASDDDDDDDAAAAAAGDPFYDLFLGYDDIIDGNNIIDDGFLVHLQSVLQICKWMCLLQSFLA